MKVWQEVVLVGGAITLGIGVIALASGGRGKTVLNISHGPNGHTDPDTGSYEFDSGSMVTLTAYPDEGYHVNVWVKDGSSQGASDSLTVDMSQNHDVVVTFTTGIPENRIPTSIVWLVNGQPGITVNLKQLYSGAFHRNTNKWHCMPVTDYANYQGSDTWVEQELTFQVLDAYQQPCANASVIITTDGQQDIVNGQLYFSDGSTSTKVTTGTDGIATARIHYANNGISQLSKKRFWYKYTAPFVEKVFCLAEGDNYPGHPPIYIWEGIGIAYNAECPNATIYGWEYEHETPPIPHYVKAEYEQNRSIGANATIGECWFGLKVALEVWVG